MDVALLIISLPTENAAVRQRVWRTLRALGAASLRDGVYVLPDQAHHWQAMQVIALEVRTAGGTAHVFRSTGQDLALDTMFDRSGEYAVLLSEIQDGHRQLTNGDHVKVNRSVKKLRRTLDEIEAIDFFPGAAQTHARNALSELEHVVTQRLSPGEPHAASGAIRHLQVEDYLGKKWATRRSPWVDRLASAWLIRRFIDPEAVIIWLSKPSECPKDALGFDFDGATFSHIGDRVTFEVLMASFQLTDSGLSRLAQTIHFLDVGGVATAESAGIESVLSGFRMSSRSDDELLEKSSMLLDGLLAQFQSEIES